MSLRTFAHVFALLEGVFLLPSAAHAVQLSQAQRDEIRSLGGELGNCHRNIALRYAHAGLTVDQIIDRALAACVQRERSIRTVATRYLGRVRAQEMLRSQQLHWRDMIGRIVLEERARH